jgi:endonuclease I
MSVSIGWELVNMKLSSFSLLLLLVGHCGLIAVADIPNGYYASVQYSDGETLKSSLHEIIDDHNVLPYSSSNFDTHDALKYLDQDPANTNNVILIYSRRSEPLSSWPQWNREHLWCNSLGIDDTYPAYSDLHALRAADQNVNSSRGNEYFDVSNTNSVSYKFPAHTEAPLCSSDENSWEPPDEVKGDIARSIFYMDVRYDGSGDEPSLVLTEGVENINSTTNYMGKLGVLLQWHLMDAVSDEERLRNDRVYEHYQGNRNPFVDHPEWVEMIYIPEPGIAISNTEVIISWDAGLVEMKVESTNCLTNNIWNAETNNLSEVDSEMRLRGSANIGVKYFRLIQE